MERTRWTTSRPPAHHPIVTVSLAVTLPLIAAGLLLLAATPPSPLPARASHTSPEPTFMPRSTVTPAPEPTCCLIVYVATVTPYPTWTPEPAPSPNVSIATAIATPTMPPPAELISFPPVEGEIGDKR